MIAPTRSSVTAWVVAGAALVTLPWVATGFALSLALTCMMFVALAVAWTMFSGPTRYLSLASSAFFGLGAYSCAWFVEIWPWWAVVAGGAVLAGAFAAAIGAVTLRLRGAYFAVITFGLAELAKHSLVYFEKSVNGSVGRMVTAAPDTPVIYWSVLALAAAAIVVRVRLERSLLGRSAAAVGMDEDRAGAIGIDAFRVKLILFCLSAAFAGAVGAAMAARWSYIEPGTVFNPFISFQTVLVSMVGGAGSLFGPVLAAIFFSLLSELLRFTVPDLYLIVLGVLLILIVLYLPRGLASLIPEDRPARKPARPKASHASARP